VATKINWKKLLSTTADELCLVSCGEDLLDQLARTPPRGTAVRTVRGHRCSSKQRTLQEWAAALQFPSWFGENWDAFDDCVRDLDWMNSRRVVVIVTRADAMLPKSTRDFATLIDILLAAQKETPFMGVFHCAPENTTALRERIRESLSA
jgi:hypothetical protein